jgi:hypothetical protein
MYCSILITVSQEEDSSLHMQWCQVCTVPFWSQYQKKGILTCIFRGVRYVLLWYCDQNGTVHTWHPWICKLGSSSFDTVIRMEQYKPLSQEGDSNLHVHGCQVCTVPFWSHYQTKRIPTCICRGVRYVLFHSDCQVCTAPFWHPCICKLESSSCDTVIRMEQYIPDTTAYVSWNPLPNLHMQGCQVCTVPIWSQYHKKGILNYICRGVRYVLFHSDHSTTRRGFQLTYAGVSTYLTPLHM